MDDTTGRRRFLELAGTGTAISIAGCNAFQSDGGDGTTETDGSDGTGGSGGGGEATVTLAVQPDQEELEQRQSEIQAEVQSENMSQLEARRAYQQRVQQAQAELTKAAAETFEGRVADESALTIDDSISQFGVFLLTGTPVALIDTLSYEEVGQLLPEPVFEEAQAQAQPQTTGQGGN